MQLSYPKLKKLLYFRKELAKFAKQTRNFLFPITFLQSLQQ